MKNRCVSLTGATGFLGHHIAAAFHAGGWSVRAVVRPGNTKEVPIGAETCEAGLHDPGALARAFAGADVVVHAAGLVRAGTAHALDEVNVGGTRAVVEAVNAAGGRLIHVSSLAAVGPGTPARPVRESDAPRPVNAYGRSKLGGELVVHERARVPWLILRPSAVYGPGDRGFLPLVRLARRGLFPLAAPGEMPFTFVYATDVAEAVRLAAESAATGLALFVGHARPETSAAMLRGMALELGTRYRPIPVPGLLVRAIAGAGDLLWAVGGRPLLDSSRYAEFTADGFVCDVSAAREQLGFTAAIDLSEGLARTVRWYRERGWV